MKFPKKILVLLPARLGDALFCTPSIALLKKNLPDTTIDALVLSQLTAEILSHNPAVNNIFVAPNKSTTENLAKNYDQAIALHPNANIAEYLSWLNINKLSVPIPHAYHHQSAQAKEFIQNIFPDFLNTDDRYQLFPQENNFQKINTLFNTNLITDKEILIGFHLGCHSLTKFNWKWWQTPQHKKVWPLRNFIELGYQLQKQFPNIRIIVTGSNAETKLAKKFLRKIPNAVDLIGNTTVLDLAALIKSLDIYLTCDTGALHVACAMGVNLIALFGPTVLKQTGPYPPHDNHTVIQASKMDDITVETVYAAFKHHINLRKTYVR